MNTTVQNFDHDGALSYLQAVIANSDPILLAQAISSQHAGDPDGDAIANFLAFVALL